MLVTDTTRMVAMSTGIDSGSSIFSTRCHGLYPMAVAASTAAGGTASSASGTERTSSAVEYKASATITLTSERMRVLISEGSTMNRAMDGMVKMIEPITMVTRRAGRDRYTSRPSGIAITSATASGIMESLMCSRVSSQTFEKWSNR